MQLNLETSGPLRDERKSWMARTYQFLGERQTPEPRPTSSRSNSAKRKVTPPKKRDVQTEPAPASPSQEAAPVKESEKKNENAGQPEEAPSPEARARVGDIWAAFSSTLSHKPAYFLKVTEQTGEDYSCQRCSSAGEVQEDAEKFSLSATKLSGTHRLFRLHQRK